MKYVLAIMWALSLVLMVFGNREGSGYGLMLLFLTLTIQIAWFIGSVVGETIGGIVRNHYDNKYANQQIALYQRQRELDLLEKIANK
jgi:Na+-transporting methylmalonyl-CoA/oxaloacetate decarboxylase gamma subunit